jgi:hypothetical protein
LEVFGQQLRARVPEAQHLGGLYELFGAGGSVIGGGSHLAATSRGE